MDYLVRIIHVPMFLVTIRSIVTMCLLLLLTALPESECYKYSVCKEQLYNCGKLSNISYPFWGQSRDRQCGGGDPFKLNCLRDDTTIIQTGSQNLQVIDIKPGMMSIMRRDLAHDVCSPQLEDTYMKPPLFSYPSSVQIISMFYDCPQMSSPYLLTFPCLPGTNYKNATYYNGSVIDMALKAYPELENCRGRLQIPATKPPPVDEYIKEYEFVTRLREALNNGFEVTYDVSPDCTKCLGRGGDCIWNSDIMKEHVNDCYYCPNGSSHCYPHKSTLNLPRKIGIGVVAAAASGLLMMSIIICYFRFQILMQQMKFWLTTKSEVDIEAFLKNQELLPQKRYKFLEVKKMTSSFKDKLGQGGFGTVYKGKLPTGYPVAVKILNASKGNGKDFINEVASVSKTCHVNIVTLLGFCLEGQQKALIYEFMPNGSLDKFINSNGLETTQSLSWDNLLRISLGIARGLEYLHRGCNTSILHFDIKPHNILLDENLNPKISDFGLAKLCPKNVSIVSMSDPRGTIGYLAPEMSNRRFGGVSHKSDVYSYGMILLDMVEGRKNNIVKGSDTSEKYFPDWIYNRLEEGDMRSDGVMTNEENEIARRMTIVGLWCIQTFPNDRPTMSRVIEMLEGRNTCVEIPPKPVLSSPPRSVTLSSTT